MKFCPVCQRCFEDEVLSCIEENHETLIEGREGNCEIIPNYRLDFLLDSAAIGETYRAFSFTLEENCCLKILPPELFADEPALLEAFLRETQDLSGITHPYVAGVFERGMLADGSVYVVTEFFTETTLRDLLDEKGVSEVSALTIAGQVAEGLNVIHTLGVLHRNIRPENIILTNGAAKIQNIDFGGIRQKIEESPSNLRYFSPEQHNGKILDEQTDVYALGLVLYEMLAGKPPFEEVEASDNLAAVQINNYNIKALLSHTLSESIEKTKRLRLKNASVFARRLRYIEQIATRPSSPSPVISYIADEIPAELLANLPTDELPPIESILSPNSFEWEHPDNIPLLTEVSEEQKLSEPAFDDNLVIEADKIDSISDYLPYVAESQNNSSVFWKPKVLATAGVFVLLTLAFGGIWMNRQFQAAQATVTQSSPVDEKPLPQAEVSEEHTKQEELTTNETSEIPDYQPREIPEHQPQKVETKKVAQVSPTVSKKNEIKNEVKKTVKDCNCDKTIQNKPAPNLVPERKVIVVTSDAKIATEQSIFNRPRVVKNPKF